MLPSLTPLSPECCKSPNWPSYSALTPSAVYFNTAFKVSLLKSCHIGLLQWKFFVWSTRPLWSASYYPLILFPPSFYPSHPSSLLLLKHLRQAPTPGPLYLLLPLSGMFFSPIFALLVYSIDVSSQKPPSQWDILSLPYWNVHLQATFHIPAILLYPFLLSICSLPEFSSVAHSCLTLYDPLNCPMPGLPVHHQLPELAQTHVHWVSDAIQPSHPLSPHSPAFSPSQHQSLFQWVSSSHKEAKV